MGGFASTASSGSPVCSPRSGTSVPACCDARREDGIVVDRAPLKAWDTDDGRVRQFNGDQGVLVGIAQLVPRRPTTGVFLTAAGQ